MIVMMKKLMLRTGAILLVMTFGMGLAQAQQGRVLIDGYFGFPNLWSSAVKRAVELDFSPEGLTTQSAGPFGGRVEYMFTDHMSAGVDFTYATTSLAFTTNGQDLNGNPATYSYSASLNRPRVLARFSYHLGNEPKFDPYFTVGMGYKGARLQIETDDPIFNEQDFTIPFNLPVAFRLGFGMRYMFTDYVGIHGEIGVGGALASGGLSFRL